MSHESTSVTTACRKTTACLWLCYGVDCYCLIDDSHYTHVLKLTVALVHIHNVTTKDALRVSALMPGHKYTRAKNTQRHPFTSMSRARQDTAPPKRTTGTTVNDVPATHAAAPPGRRSGPLTAPLHASTARQIPQPGCLADQRLRPTVRHGTRTQLQPEASKQHVRCSRLTHDTPLIDIEQADDGTPVRTLAHIPEWHERPPQEQRSHRRRH